MRYLEITVPEGRRQAVLTILEDEGVDYVVSDETSGRGYEAVVRFPLPTRAVEPTLDRLNQAGVGEEARVVVVDAETVISQQFDDLLEQHSHDGAKGERTSRQVLRTKADELTPAFPIYVVMLLISAVVATSGLLADSPAVVVGSMVIAPLIGPALASSVGIVTGDDGLKATGFRYQVVGLAVVVAASIGLASLARLAGLEPGGVDIVVVAELQERVSPNVFSLAVALGAGVAGILSLTRGFSEAIVGVMIAAALIPPAAAVGITVAWGMYGAAAGAAVLVAVNVLSINLAALATLWVAGYRPQGLFEVSPTRRPTYTYAAVFAVALLVLAAPLAGITLLDFQSTQLSSAADDEVETALEEPVYDDFELDSVEVVLDDDYPFRSIDQVVVTVSGDDPGQLPELADRIHDGVSAHDESAVVEVRFIVAEQRGGEVETSDSIAHACKRVESATCVSTLMIGPQDTQADAEIQQETRGTYAS
ncbi:TIGR00341 family protein [Natrialbaceae archaeon AArc-T1-2]|uniref:TIGR00341 family protein n=1 Tax=Natrialbaceae archaeon AArc-T1-2 TaxID=3053904 RepID=UPI00255AA265|nr:TIGR00341 family protein [Natrialbaceae archaeon AArc-T1-2]WIV68072.1 TIGR00341 family protein [Natrialbaceae archaeon AArc-T1-2]